MQNFKGVFSKSSGNHIVAPFFVFRVRDFKLWLLAYMTFLFQLYILIVMGQNTIVFLVLFWYKKEVSF